MLSEEKKKKNGPIAVESLFGWVLISYYDKISTTNNSNGTHMLCVNFEICVNIRMMIIKIMKKLSNYHSDAKLRMENKNDDIENLN